MKGGKREGAGRPAKGMRLVTYRLLNEDIDFIKDTATEVGVSQAHVVHELVETYKEVAEGKYERAVAEE